MRRRQVLLVLVFQTEWHSLESVRWLVSVISARVVRRDIIHQPGRPATPLAVAGPTWGTAEPPQQHAHAVWCRRRCSNHKLYTDTGGGGRLTSWSWADCTQQYRPRRPAGRTDRAWPVVLAPPPTPPVSGWDPGDEAAARARW